MSPDKNTPQGLCVDYFDGRRAKPLTSTLRREGDQAVLTTPEGELRLPWQDIEWPERTRHGGRTAHLVSGGSLHSADGPAWDAWLRAHQVSESWVVRAQQSWRATLLAVVMLVAMGAVMYRWGLPWATSGVLHWVPITVDAQIGQRALDSMDGQWLHPSRLPHDTQRRIAQGFEQAVQRYRQAHPSPHQAPPAVRVYFRASKLGPNAFALPGGSLVLTDELVALLEDREDVLIGVLGHELGHVEARHGMRAVVQSTLLGAVTTLALGDMSGLLASAPAVLGHLHYSRQMEREADDTAIRFLKANGMPPSIMVTLFERLRDDDPSRPPDQDEGGLGIALSSHPADEERMARFREAGQGLGP